MTVDLQPGSNFYQYVLERRLGGGGFGDVWLAHDAAGARVALKVLHGQYQSDEVASLRAEIELLAANASNRSSHIVRVLGGGSEPAPFVVMEYIEGRDLSQEIARRGALPIDEVLNIAEAIADALVALQRAGIIHRDIKPANVIIDNQGVIKLTDFGIAKIVGVDSATATGQISLSMAYAAPEVWDGKASQVSDHYAFGALLFQCLTGRSVFNGNYAEIYRHHLHTPPDLDALPAETPLALRDMIGECLAKAPEQRPQSAALLLSAVEAARREMSADTGATVFVQQNVEPKRLGPWVIESRSADRAWTFLCNHQTSGEKALLELHFADELAYMELLRKAVDVNSSLVPLGAERLIGTSRLVMRPGEAWQNAPNAEFQFWVAREVSAPTPPPRAISASNLQKITDALNQILAIAKANVLQLDMRAENLALKTDGSVLVRRPGLPPFPDGDPTTDVIAFLESLPLDQQTMFVAPAMTGVLDAAVITPAPEAQLTPVAPPPAPAPSRNGPEPVAKPGGGSKTLVFAGLGVAAIAAVAIGAYLVLGNTSKSSTKGPASAAAANSTPASTDSSTAPYGTTPSANGTPSSVVPASATFVAQGLAAGTAKDYATANADYSKAIDADPKNADAYYRRGISFVLLNKPDQALPDFNKAIELKPTTASYYLVRGELQKNQQKTDLAMADYTKAITLDPQNAGAYFDRGSLYGDLSNKTAGIADLSKAIEINPKYAAAFNNRGVQYRDSGKSDLAVADFTTAIQLDSKYALPIANRGRLYYDLKRYDEALADDNKVLDLEPTSTRYVSRGLVYSALLKYDLAAADYTKATQLDPKNAVAFYNVAAADANQKLYDDAITAATKAIAIDSNYYLAYYGRGLDYKAENKIDLARADFEKAKSLAKTADDTQRAQTQLDSLK